MAADSQTTFGTHSKTQDANKIRIVQLKDAQLLVAEAGSASSSQRVIDIMGEMGASVALTDYRSGADLAQAAMTKYLQELRRAQLDCSMEELREFITRQGLWCSLMIAHYFNGKPYIYIADMETGAVNKASDEGLRHFALMGTGEELGLYLMRELTRKGMPFRSALAVLLYVIGEIKANDHYCSGNTRIYYIQPDNFVDRYLQSYVNDLAGEIERFNESTWAERNKQMVEMLDRATQAHYAKGRGKP